MFSIRTSARRAASTAMIGAILFPAALRAQEQPPLQELFLAQLPYTQEKGEFQFTLTHARELTNRRTQSAAAVEFGISSRWQVELEALGREQLRSTDSRHDLDGHGLFESMSLSAARGFVSRNGLSRMLLGGEMEIPLGSAEVGESAVMMGPSMAVMRDFLPLHGLRVLASGAYAAPIKSTKGAPRAENEYNIQIAAFLPVSRARFTLELSRSSNEASESAPSLLAAPGVILALPHGIEFGVAAPVSFDRNSRFVSNVFRLIYEF